MKYYAVKNGRKPGIYTTWAECKEQVDGYSCAAYKSFTDKAAALEFLGVSPQEKAKTAEKPCGTYAYVDGSYNVKSREFSFGAVLFADGKMQKFSQKFSDPQLAEMRNVAGELKGAEFVISYCAEHGIESVDIYHDYEGIAAWADGRWKTNKDGTKAYKALYDRLSDKVAVRFVKVKGHSGDKYNDMADALAKGALGISK